MAKIRTSHHIDHNTLNEMGKIAVENNRSRSSEIEVACKKYISVQKAERLIASKKK